jgi:hypothetical protein
MSTPSVCLNGVDKGNLPPFFKARSQNYKQRLLALSYPSVWNNSASTGRISMKFDILLFFEKLPREIKFH